MALNGTYACITVAVEPIQDAEEFKMPEPAI